MSKQQGTVWTGKASTRELMLENFYMQNEGSIFKLF